MIRSIQTEMILPQFQDKARELIARRGYHISVARAYAYTLADGECCALECSVETWGIECRYHKYPNEQAQIWISGGELWQW